MSARVGALVAGGAVLLAAVAAGVVLLARDGPVAAPGLPAAAEYHALRVDSGDADRLLLGTHDGIYTSTDAGARWSQRGLGGADAMSLADAGESLWVAGHGVLARSNDGGGSWTDVRPQGLPSRDVHGLAADPADGRTLYAAVAQAGLYRSTDGGETFVLRSAVVGGEVMALAALPNGGLLAGDMGRGLVSSRDGGRSWRLQLEAQVGSFAVDPARPQRVLASGPGVALSTDGGRTWRPVLQIDRMGPVAWAAGGRAYAISADRRLYRSDDGGETWKVRVE